MQSINQCCVLVVANSIHTCWVELEEKEGAGALSYPLMPPASCSLELLYLSGLLPRRFFSSLFSSG